MEGTHSTICECDECVEMRRAAGNPAPACSPGLFRPCATGHVFQFTGGSTDRRCPDGIPCQCGAMLSKWETCPTCGQDHLTAVPVNSGIPE